METLLNALQNADRICKQANAHFEKAVQIEQQLESFAAQLKKAKTKWIIIGVVIWVVAGSIGSIFGGIPVLGKILQLVVSLASIAAGVYIGTNGYKKEKSSVEAQIRSIQGKAQEERNAAQQIFEANYEALSFLPDDYWYPMATSYLVKAIASKRVDNLGDALDRFDAQLHRWKVEEANANLLAQQ
jgi:ABC-type transport system involved in cytochrome bd biosynthesis fused ATPase/permease subunit